MSETKPDPDRVATRAGAPQDAERDTGAADPEAQAEALLEESDERTDDARDREKNTDKWETRDSEEATPPPR